MPSQLNDWIGRDLIDGRYRVIRKLGEGGMGAVYEASDRTLGAKVVIKVPHFIATRDAEFSERFGREIRSLVHLSHPHIVRVIDAGICDGSPFAVMQFLAGGSLEDHLAINTSQPAEVSRWLEDICKALDFVHSQNFLHRDIKPGNILFDDHGNVYLSDFGIAKALAATTNERLTTLTGTGMVLGTPEYMAPELILGSWVDGRADQYALAVTVYEMLSDRRPFEGASPTAVMVAASTEAPAPLQKYAAHIAGSVCLVINKALARNTQDRYPNCLAFATAFNAAISTSPQPLNADLAKLACPTCGRLLRVPAQFASQEVTCPNCKSGLLVAHDRSALECKVPRRGGAAVVSQAVNAPAVTAILARPSAATATVSRRERPWPQLRKSRWVIVSGIGLLASMLVFLFVMLAISVLSSKRMSDRPTSAEVASSQSESDRRLPVNTVVPHVDAVPVSNDTPPPAKPALGNNSRTRWINSTYDHSVEETGAGVWEARRQNKLIAQFKETGRTNEYIELFCAATKKTTRLCTEREEYNKNGSWEWVAFGYWSSPENDAEFLRIESQVVADPPPGDTRIRWINSSYNVTFYRRTEGFWDEKDNMSGHVDGHALKETARTNECVEGIFLKHRHYFRMYPNRIEEKIDGIWKWSANGNWDTSPEIVSDGVLYLADLKESSVEVIHYTGRDLFWKGVYEEDGRSKKISLDGKQSPKAILAHPKPSGQSKVTYSVKDRRYKYFEAVVGVEDTRKSTSFSPLTFEVVGDGKVLWQSRPVIPDGEPQACTVMLPDISQLELVVQCPAKADFAWAVWFEPRLTNTTTESAR